MTYSPHITDYFELMDSEDRAATIRTFATDAQVIDDGKTYRGRDEILSWLDGPASEYTTTSTHLSAETNELGVSIVVRLVGDFPGGQVDLRHDFVVDAEGLIEALTIAV